MINKDAIAATLRALAKIKTDIGFQLSNEDVAKVTPKSITLPEIEDEPRMREVADELAARFKFFMIAPYMPDIARGSYEHSEIFDALEKHRAEVVLSKKYDGVLWNLNSQKKLW